MRLVLIGINHRTAPVALRDQLAVDAQRLPEVLAAFREAFKHGEAVLLSTCNRTELYMAAPATVAPEPDALMDFLARQTGVPLSALAAATTLFEQADAASHLFRVTAGLDAMAVGESQVLGQVRRAYEAAGTAGTARRALHRLFQAALQGARKARRESGVEAMDQSISTMAVEFAGGLFESFDDKVVVGVGAGEITKATLLRMQKLNPARMCVVNRSAPAGVALAHDLGLGAAGAKPWDELDRVLVEADVVITGTAANEPVITLDRFRSLAKSRRNRPLFLIDLAVPRDVEPDVGKLPNVYLYNIDDLNKALSKVPGRRENIVACDAIAMASAAACWGQLERRDVGKVVRKLRTKLSSIGDAEQQRTARKLAALPQTQETLGATPDELNRLLEEHTHRLINKILHLPLTRLDPGPNHDHVEGADLGALCRLFGLDEEALADDTQPDDTQPNKEDA
ncbi:MAG: glutamyl-tRNA reductase [Algisphaera sp.]